MKLAVLLVLALVAVASAGEVVVLTDSDFDSKTASGVWLVKLYAPWCGHCKRLAPTWDELAIQAAGFNVAKVDCTTESTVCQKLGVRGYPTIKLFVDGEPIDYKGARAIPDFLKFVADNAKNVAHKVADVTAETAHKVADAASETANKAAETVRDAVVGDKQVAILTDSDFKSSISKGYWYVKFYAPWCGHCKRMAPTWDELAGQAAGFGVAKVDCTQEKATCQEYGVRGYPTIKLFKDGEVVADYKGARDLSGFQSFFAANS